MTDAHPAPDSWPFLGRERELETILRACRTGGGVVLAGAGGVGRTRLAREALSRVAATPECAHWVTATRAGAAIAFGALAHLLPEEVRLDGDPLAVLRQLTRRFEEARGPRPVLVVDDAHLLDPASAAFVHHLATRGLAFLIVTRRAGEPACDAIVALTKEELLTRIDLAPLPVSVLAELLDAHFGHPLDAVSRRELARLSGGLPLMLRELLHALHAADVLRRVHGIWRWTGRLPVPRRLAEAIDEQLGGVDESVRALLEIVACAEPAPVAALDGMADEQALATAEQSGLVVMETVEDRLVARLAHPLHGEVIRATLSSARARALWARMSKIITVRSWLLDAGIPLEPAILLAAARTTLTRLDHGLAERFARAARARDGGDAADLVLAEILAHQGRYEEAADVLPPLAPPDGPQLARWAITSAAVAYGERCDVVAAERALARAAEHGGHAGTTAVRYWIMLSEGRGKEALDAGPAAPSSSGSAVWVSACVITAAGLGGRLATAADTYRRGLADAHDRPWERAPIGYAYCLALLANGRPHDAGLLAEREYEIALAGGTAAVVGGWTACRGAVAKAQGRVETAARAFHEAIALLDGHDLGHMGLLCHAELAGAAALAGDTALAAAWSHRADRYPHAGPLLRPWIELDRAWSMAAGGNVSGAAAHARQAAEHARHAGQPAIEATALYDAARLGDARVVRRRLAVLAGDLGTPAAAAMSTAAAGLAEPEAGALDRAADAFVRLGLWLHAAETATAAARTHQRAGRLTHAHRSLEKAAVLRGHCPQARTPLLDTTRPVDVLTRREREVVLLAAARCRSREIAIRLGLSVRTVDNYLCRAYAKLGVSGRTELADLLPR
ncbi:hypothetical protein ITP53_13975 [Nonomuraea sp. K274]|uniref:HTH luxR-type domain-containing protein n=1 Tax=Nonomuraea cypriaca TaxID=1187855 RepID=A0A931F060_9ACTN|nr:helix-turn-helix transcriptional regulator [Nonomuraea cypriaca]MBF8186831.1 hypothetical protein [Nonomuraea cypriaca]